MILNGFRKFITVMMAAAPQIYRLKDDLHETSEIFDTLTCNLDYFFKMESVTDEQIKFWLKKKENRLHDIQC